MLTGSQLGKKFPVFYGVRNIIIAFTSARQLYLSWASSFHSMPLNPISWRSILLFPSNLSLCLPVDQNDINLSKIITSLEKFSFLVSRAGMMPCSLMGVYRLYCCLSLGVKCASEMKMETVCSSEILLQTHQPTLSSNSQEFQKRKLTS
jgi:hypothetical protein